MIIYDKDKKEIGRIEEANGVTTLALSIEGTPKVDNFTKKDLQEKLNGLKERSRKIDLAFSWDFNSHERHELSQLINLSKSIGQTEQLLKDRFGV